MSIASTSNGTSFLLSNNHSIASTSGADGLLFAPDGNLLVAGQGNNLTEVTPGGTIVKTVAPGGGSFHLALTSSAPNALVYHPESSVERFKNQSFFPSAWRRSARARATVMTGR